MSSRVASGSIYSSLCTLHSSLPFGELLVLVPALPDRLLRAGEEELGRRRVALLEHAVARLRVDVVFERNLRLARIQLERVLVLGGGRGVEAVERPVARLDRELLLVHALRHIYAVRDALAVGDDERRPFVRLGFEEI